MEHLDLNRVWKLVGPGLGFLAVLLFTGVSAIPAAAQAGYVGYQQPYQRPGQSTTTTREEKVGPDGTKTSKETKSTQSQGSKYLYSGLPGKFIRTGGHTLNQGKLAGDHSRRRYYRFEFASQGLPKHSNPNEAYWFELNDGKLMLVDPLITQRYCNNPR
jgi:hypothetical protein